MLISAERLTNLADAIVQYGGGSKDEAATVADHLVLANMSGHDSHGVGMLPAYIKGVKSGNLFPGKNAEIVIDQGSLMVIDGHFGFGQVVAKQATEIAIERAKETGLAVVGLRNAFHIGRIGTYGEMCGEAGLVSIHYVNALSTNSIVAPYGGMEARLTTNPYCTAIPATDKHPMLILDMATSTIAHGKARVAYLNGKEVPENSLLDHEGYPTNDPKVLFEEPKGVMRSAGLHKGYGLALVCDLLAGGLTGGGTYNPKNLVEGRVQNNMLSILLDPKIFSTDDYFSEEIDQYTAWIKSAKPAPGFDEIMVPGDPERKARAKRGSEGIPLDDGTWEALLETADLVDLPREEVMRIVGN